MSEPNNDELSQLFEEGITKQTMREAAEAASIFATQYPQVAKNLGQIMDRVIEQVITDETFTFDDKLRNAVVEEFNSVPGVDCSPDDPLVTQFAEFIASIIEQGRQQIVTTERSSLAQYTPELTAITGSDDPKFVEALEDIASIFLHFVQNSADMPGLTEVKKALSGINRKARALQDYVTVLENQPEVHDLLATTLALRDEAKLLDNLNQQLNVLLDTTALIEDNYQDSRKKWPQQQLAMRIGQLLRDRGIKLTKYRNGAFCQCLTLVLEATGYAEPYDPWEKNYDPLNAIRAIWPLLEDK